jgi:uncharacterized membrane protein
MTIALMLIIALHVLSGVFWAGTTFALARGQSLSVASLRKPQLGAAAVAVASGALLGHLAHPGAFGGAERVLALGAVAALLAAAIQVFNVRGPMTAQRIAAALLAVSVLCMVLARYAG